MPLLTELENLFGFVLQRFRADGAENQVLFCRQDADGTLRRFLPDFVATIAESGFFGQRHRLGIGIQARAKKAAAFGAAY